MSLGKKEDGSGVTRLTTNNALETAPTWSPDGTKIAFTSSRTGGTDIYVMNAKGSAQSRLTTHSGLDLEPAWSPDGASIAFSTNRHGILNLEIYVMPANGTQQTRLTTNPSMGIPLVWSPDGLRVAFTTNRHGLLNFELYVMNANGTSPTRLTTNSAADTSRTGSGLSGASKLPTSHQGAARLIGWASISSRHEHPVAGSPSILELGEDRPLVRQDLFELCLVRCERSLVLEDSLLIGQDTLQLGEDLLLVGHGGFI